MKETDFITKPDEPHGIRARLARFKRALTAVELAGLLSVSPITIYKQAKKGIIPSFRVGTSVRFDPRKTADWICRQ
jgi:excisionase family DNA binding protein